MSVSLPGAETDAPDAAQDSPWGVAAHLLHGETWSNADTAFGLSHRAGIVWMRDGIGFFSVCAKPNQYNFDRYDELLDRLEKEKIEPLIILSGFDWEIQKTRPDLVPLYAHPEAWRQYVRATVTHYRGRIRNWEIWNEEDGGFWKPSPNAAQYVSLLQIAYEEIKAIDPQSTVLVGGLCGWNSQYLKEMYKAGVKGCFDAIAVHSYGIGLDGNLRTIRERNEFNAVLMENGQADIPIWITECGQTTSMAALTQQQPGFVVAAIHYALDRIHHSVPGDLVVGVAASPLTKDPAEVGMDRSWLPGITLRPIPFDKLSDLDPTTCPVLIGEEGKNIDQPLLEPLRHYVERGGLLLAMGGLPFYTVNTPGNDGIWRSADEPGVTNPLFRIGFEAFWTKKGLPTSTDRVRTAPDAEQAGLPMVHNVYVNRFLSEKNLFAGDQYYPIIQALDATGNPIGEGMALYTYHDWKGGILMSTVSVGGLTEEDQARLLPRAYLSFLSVGVRKIFWYDLHNDGTQAGENEYNFGLIHWDWTPKPALDTYWEMTAALGIAPVFVHRLDSADQSVWALIFRRAEDGKSMLAAWSTEKTGRARIVCKGENAPVLLIDGNTVHYALLDHSADDYQVLEP